MAAHGCRGILLVIFVVLTRQSVGASLLETASNISDEYWGNIRKLKDLLGTIQLQRHFENVVIYTGSIKATSRSEAGQCPFREVQSVFEVPIVFVNLQMSGQYRRRFTLDTLLIVCATSMEAEYWQDYATALNGLRNVRHIVYLGGGESEVQKYCRSALLADVNNVLIILRDFATTGIYFSCSRSPDYLFRAKDLKENLTVYENQFDNMHGAPIVIHPGQSAPRTLMTYDRSGRLKLEGYVGKLVTTFARKHNATLVYKYPVVVGRQRYNDVMRIAINNNTLDIAVALDSHTKVQSFDELTYPYELTNFCLMIPFPRRIPINELFAIIISRNVLIIIFVLFTIFGVLLTASQYGTWRQITAWNVLLNDKTIRGLLGQSFTLISNPSFNLKLICFLICYTSLMTVTMYGAFLQSYLTEPPLRAAIRGYKDIEAAGLKVLIRRRDLNFFKRMPANPLKIYAHLFQIIDNNEEFAAIRFTLNPQYIYTATRTNWLVLVQQQRYFDRHLFYYDDNFCLVKLMLFGLPIRSRLPYRDLFEDHILQVRESGLQEFWMAWNFYDMLRLKRLSAKNIVVHDNKRTIQITLYDFYWIWWVYLWSIAICCLVFSIEAILAKCKASHEESCRTIQNPCTTT